MVSKYQDGREVVRQSVYGSDAQAALNVLQDVVSKLTSHAPSKVDTATQLCGDPICRTAYKLIDQLEARVKRGNRLRAIARKHGVV